MTTREAKNELRTYAKILFVIDRLRHDARMAELAAASPRTSSYSAAASRGGGSYDEKIIRMLERQEQVTDAERKMIFVEIILDTILDTAEKKSRKILVDFCIKERSCEAIAEDINISAARVYQLLEDALEIYVFNRNLIVQMLDFDPFAHDRDGAQNLAHAREL